MKKIYISGKITGLDYNVAKQNFEAATIELINDSDKNIAVNPMQYDGLVKKIYKTNIPTWQNYMRFDIKLITDCDAIYMLSNYQDSKGALAEREVAIRLGLEVIYQ